MPKPIIQGPYRTFRRLNFEESYLEFEGSTITIPMRGRRTTDSPWMEEEIKLNAFMRLEIFPPYVNNLRTREFQFIIRDWYLYGRSPMLNRLFFDDPRGRFVETHDDYAPAVVTFNVSNNYDVKVLQGNVTADRLFAPTRQLEIHGLTSQHLRGWVRHPERNQLDRYSLPESVIYWQVLSPDSTDKRASEALARMIGAAPKAPIVVFHTKPPTERESGFRVADNEDVAEHLLAIGSLGDGQRFIAREPETGAGGGLLANRVQLTGNTVLSPLTWPRQPLEIRWALAEGLGAAAVSSLIEKEKDKMLSGAIRIVSPARSLGTADQGPDVGDPIDSADFPARITYAINYDIAINSQAFVEDQAGIAIAVGALEIPPRDVTVAFDKPHIGKVLDSFLEFGPGHCTGMHEIPQDEYLHNVNFARYWRSVPLAETDDWTTFEDFDPAKSY